MSNSKKKFLKRFVWAVLKFNIHNAEHTVTIQLQKLEKTKLIHSWKIKYKMALLTF